MKSPRLTAKTERDFWTLGQYERAIQEARIASDKFARKSAELSGYAAEMARETVKFDVRDLPLLKDA